MRKQSMWKEKPSSASSGNGILKALLCDHKLCALAPQVWYLKLPTYCTKPFMVWNEQSSSVCLFCFAKRVREKRKRKEKKEKKKGNIRCGSIVTLGRTHTTMATENNNSNVTNTNTHEHRAQKDCFLYPIFYLLFIHCNSTEWMSQCCG